MGNVLRVRAGGKWGKDFEVKRRGKTGKGGGSGTRILKDEDGDL